MINFRPLDQHQINTDTQTVPMSVGNKFNFRPIQSTPQNTPPEVQGLPVSSPEEGIASKVAGMGLAAVAGLNNGAISTGETALDAGTFLLDKLGAISPSTHKQLNKYISGGADSLKVKPEDNDILSKAMDNHSIISGGAKLAVEVPALLSTTIPKLGTGLLGAANTLGANVAANAITSAGMVNGQDLQGQDMAAKWSAPLSLAGAAVGLGASKVANKLLLPQKIKDYIAPINKEVADSGMSFTDQAAQSVSNVANRVSDESKEIWGAIKAMPGTISPGPIKQQVQMIFKQNGSQFKDGVWDHSTSILEKPQISALTNIEEHANALTNMDDAISLKHAASKGYNKFDRGTATDATYSLYKGIQNNIDTQIDDAAKEAGLTSDLAAAKKFHKENVVPLQNANAFDIAKATANKDIDPSTYNLATKTLFTNVKKSPEAMQSLLNSMDENGSKIVEHQFISETFKDIMDSPDAVNMNNALLQINRFKSKFSSVLSSESKESLEGIKKVMQSSGANAGAKPSTEGSMVAERIGGMGVGGAIGGAIGSVGGPIGIGLGSTIGGAVGYGSAQAAHQALNHLLQSPKGVKILQYIGQDKPGSNKITRLISTSLPAFVAGLSGEDNGNKPASE